MSGVEAVADGDARAGGTEMDGNAREVLRWGQLYHSVEVSSPQEFLAAMADQQVTLIVLTRNIVLDQPTNPESTVLVQVNKTVTSASSGPYGCSTETVLQMAGDHECASAESSCPAVFDLGCHVNFVVRDLTLVVQLKIVATSISGVGITLNGLQFVSDCTPEETSSVPRQEFHNTRVVLDCLGTETSTMYNLALNAFPPAESLDPSKPASFLLNHHQDWVASNVEFFFGQREFAEGSVSRFVMAFDHALLSCHGGATPYRDWYRDFHEGHPRECYHPLRPGLSLFIGHRYKGQVNSTSSGEPCLAWEEVERRHAGAGTEDPSLGPLGVVFTPSTFPTYHLDHNFCSQPHVPSFRGELSKPPDVMPWNDEDTRDLFLPWCYVSDGAGGMVAQYCEVPRCPAECTCDGWSQEPGPSCDASPTPSPTAPTNTSYMLPPPDPSSAPTTAAAIAPTSGGDSEAPDAGDNSKGNHVGIIVGTVVVAVFAMAWIAGCLGLYFSRRWKEKEANAAKGNEMGKRPGSSKDGWCAGGETNSGSRSNGSDDLLLDFKAPPLDPDAFKLEIFDDTSVFGVASVMSQSTRQSAFQSACQSGHRELGSVREGEEGVEEGDENISGTGARLVGAGQSGGQGKATTKSDSKDSERRMPMKVDEQLQLEGVIGKGGFGTVYEGYWNGVAVAVKMIDMVASKAQHRLFMEELSTSLSLRHPNIIQTFESKVTMERVVELGFQNGTHEMVHHQGWLVLELGAGDLLSAANQGLFREGRGHNLLRILSVLLNVADGVAYMHMKGIVHRDIKLQNIFYIWQGGAGIHSSNGMDDKETNIVAKIGDFGLATTTTKLNELRQEALEKNGTVPMAGTVTHLAPEVLSAGRMSFAMDVWAFGVVMWMLWVGEQPYRRSNITRRSQLVEFLVEGNRLEFPPECPAEYVSLAKRCWEAAPVDRPSFPTIAHYLRGMRNETRAKQGVSQTSSIESGNDSSGPDNTGSMTDSGGAHRSSGHNLPENNMAFHTATDALSGSSKGSKVAESEADEAVVKAAPPAPEAEHSLSLGDDDTTKIDIPPAHSAPISSGQSEAGKVQPKAGADYTIELSNSLDISTPANSLDINRSQSTSQAGLSVLSGSMPSIGKDTSNIFRKMPPLDATA